jgi:hypothetical protein
MSDVNSNNANFHAQPLAEIVSVAAEGRLNNDSESKAAAFVDVTLYLRPGGSITIHGCTVLHKNGKEPTVLLPSRKGDRRNFPIVSNSGDIRRVIEQAVLEEFEHLRGATA